MVIIISMKKICVFLKNKKELLIVFTAALICLLIWKLNLFRKIDYKVYDFMLPFTKEIKSDTPVLLVEVDDFAIEEVGDWPWTRDIMGNAILRMKELGAERVVFDIEYLSPASLVLNQKALGNLDAYPDYTSLVNALVVDTDDYFSRCIQFFGKSWLTINMQSLGIERSQEEQLYAEKRFGLNIVEDPFALIPLGNDAIRKLEGQASGNGSPSLQYLTPAVSPLINAGYGACFTNCFVDLDGSRRRIQLLEEADGTYIGQLAFAPLVDLLGVKKIRREKNFLFLENARLPGKNYEKTIKIPLDDTGCMLINWIHSTYQDSFGGKLGNVKENRHESFAFLRHLDGFEEEIAGNIAFLSTLDFIPEIFSQAAESLNKDYSDILAVKKALLGSCEGFDVNGNANGGGINQGLMDQYFEMRRRYFDFVRQFVNAPGFLELSELLLENEGEDYASLPEYTKSLLQTYDDYERDMKQKYENAFCFVGYTASASTDFGITPFDRMYANLGVHANVANTILHEDFIRPLSALWGFYLAIALVLITVILLRNAGLAKKIAFGIVYVLLAIAVLSVLMICFKIFIPSAMSVTFVLLCFIGNSVYNFIQLEKNRKTLRRGFDAYVAPEVVNQIVKNPSKLALGGENRRLTALFSDVRTFSGFTECINRVAGEAAGAVRLVEILNGYLGMLSDAIMAEKGTIDKYVGDEIVSFFGAPIENPDNAFNACMAAIRMKQAEEIYNREHEAELPRYPGSDSPFLLKSRIGLNTGDMVVGNMGTRKKLNYTVMGNNVNLASRLEGTNKVYDSWIMASESTWKDADRDQHKGLLLARQLDCVRVINVEKPVQIYSITGLRSELSAAEIEASELFNAAMDFYLKGRDTPDQPKDPEELKKAIEYFEKAYSCFHYTDPQDKKFISMEKKMIERCRFYLEKGLPSVWDGVYTMTSK